MDVRTGTENSCRYSGVCPLAWVSKGQWEWSLLTPGVWGHRAWATEWQGALALPGTFQAPERVARGQGAGGKERAF